MDLHKSMLLAYVILQIFISEWVLAVKQNIYKKVIFQNDQNECVCFDQSPQSQTISYILDPKNEGIERLIVFLYRSQNQTIYTYIPDTRKQSLLPDLQYENEDILTIASHEHLHTLFSNSNKIKYRQFQFKPPNNVFIDDNDVSKQNVVQNDNEQKPSLDNIFSSLPTSHEIQTHVIDQSPQYITNEINTTHPHDLIHDIILEEITPQSKLNLSKNLESEAAVLDETIEIKNKHSPEKNINKWFTNKKTNKKLSSSIEHTDINGTLGQQIREALEKHGMFVSSTGELKDTNGNVLNITNLYLRPFLIGDTLQYNSVIKHPNGSITMPEKMSYTESLLLALLKPPKIIAILPLGKFNLPSNLDFRRNILKQYSTQQVKVNSRMNNRNEKEASLRPILIDDLLKESPRPYIQRHNDLKSSEFHLINSSKLSSKENYKIKVKKLRDPILKSNKYLKTKPNVNSFETEPAHQILPIIFEHSKKDLLTKVENENKKSRPDDSKISVQELKVLLQKIVDQHKNKDTLVKISKEDILKELGDTYDEHNVIQSTPIRISPIPRGLTNIQNSIIEDGEDDGDVSHDFRIIGGAAATISGSPISNKGRSGISDK